MAVKKDKRPALRYLLKADPGLRRLSLKKLSEGRKKTTAAKRPARTKSPVAKAVESVRWPWTVSPGAMASAIIGVVAAVTLMTAGGPSEPTVTDAQSEAPASEARLVEEPANLAPARVEKPATPAKPRASEPTKAPAVKPAAVVTVSDVAPVKPEMEAAPAESVTITGCLAKGKDAFWLKDAAGPDVPKARSWRTGFFKKGSPRIDVVSASTGLKLSDYVGQRVAATGVLTDRDLRASSIGRVASSCN